MSDSRSRLVRSPGIVLLMSVLAVSLAGSAGAIPGRLIAPNAVVTTYFGPFHADAGHTTVLHAVNTDSVAQSANLAIFDSSGAVVKAATVNVPPQGSALTAWGWDIDNDGFMRLRSQSPFVLGTLEVIDTATASPIELMGPTQVLGPSPQFAVCGPATMSDELTEEALFTNVGATSRTVTITFYGEGGMVVDDATLTVGPLQTAAQSFPVHDDGEIYSGVVTVAGGTPSILSAWAGIGAEAHLGFQGGCQRSGVDQNHDGPAAPTTTYLGPIWADDNPSGPAGRPLPHSSGGYHALNTDGVPRTANLRVTDSAGLVVESLTASIAPDASITVTSGPVHEVFWGRLLSQNSLAKGSVEVVDGLTGAPMELSGPTALIGGPAGSCIAGPMTMSDELSELVLLTNVAPTGRTVTVTFYDDAGIVLDEVAQTLGPQRSSWATFPQSLEGESVHVELTVTGASSILAAVVGLDDGGDTGTHEVGHWCG